MDKLKVEKNNCVEVVINEEDPFNNMSKILNISELDEKFYNHNIISSPCNSISLYNDIMKKEPIFVKSKLKNQNDEKKFFLETSPFNIKENIFSDGINGKTLFISNKLKIRFYLLIHMK